MRIDKFVWAVRLYKTRTLAGKMVKEGKVLINGEQVKPGRLVNPKDEISIKSPPTARIYKVIDFPKSRVGAKLVDLYRKDKTPKEEFEKTDLLKFAKDYYRKKGTGRPTKKDRRDIDDFTDSPEEL